MPRQEAHLRRWQVAAILLLFALNGAAFVVGLVILTHQGNRVTEQQRSIVAIRNQQIEQLKKGAVRSCRSRHKLAIVARRLALIDTDALKSSLAQGARTLKGPAAKLPGIRGVLLRGQAQTRRLLKLSKTASALSDSADCPVPVHVPPSPHVPPPPPKVP